LLNEPNFCLKNQLTGIFRLDEHDACDGSSRDRRPLRANLGWPAVVEFIDENGGGPGVRLRKPPKQKR
jgi:hypothetical protein